MTHVLLFFASLQTICYQKWLVNIEITYIVFTIIADIMAQLICHTVF